MESSTLHPTPDDWQSFRDDTISAARKQHILNHVANCDFCAEIWKCLLTDIEAPTDVTPPASGKAAQIAARIYRRAFKGESFSLQPFDDWCRPSYLMAADGGTLPLPEIENLGEAFCLEPDVVLRLMRNNRNRQTYVQVVSDNPALFAGVLVQLPQLGTSYVTDDSGRADVVIPNDARISAMTWVLKLPDAEFTLEPLALGPDPSDDNWSTVLEAAHGGRIRLSLERQGSSRFIKLDILELEGRLAQEPLIAAVSLDSQVTTHRAGMDNPVLLPIETLPTTMYIRFYW